MSGGERLGGCHKGAGRGRRRCSQRGRLATERAHPTAGEGERAGWGGRPGPRAAEPAALPSLPPGALEQRGLRAQRRRGPPLRCCRRPAPGVSARSQPPLSLPLGATPARPEPDRCPPASVEPATPEEPGCAGDSVPVPGRLQGLPVPLGDDFRLELRVQMRV